MGIDLLSVSGHKIHGPKGIGFLYVSYKIKIKPIIFGGGQQKNMRSGTENVCGIMGLGVAVKKIFDNFDEDNKRMCELRDTLAKGLLESEGTKVNGPLSDEETKAFAAPHIVSVSVKDQYKSDYDEQQIVWTSYIIVLLVDLEDYRGEEVDNQKRCLGDDQKPEKDHVPAAGLTVNVFDDQIDYPDTDYQVVKIQICVAYHQDQEI